MMIRRNSGRRFAAAAVVAAVLMAVGGATAPARAAAPAGAVGDCLLLQVKCYTPQQFQVAYGMRPLLDRGVSGHGETVTVIDFAPAPGSPPYVTDIRADLARFDSVFHLPAARIRVVTSLAGHAATWWAGIEEVTDTEMVHAAAPGATIRVMLLPAAALGTAAAAIAAFIAGLRLAVADTDVISISASLGEHFFTRDQAAEMNSVLAEAAARHVTVVAAAGDQGAVSDMDFASAPVKEISLPASDPLVLAVGGTRLAASHATGAYIGETAWNDPPDSTGGYSVASAGGFSHLFTRPAYQDSVPGTGAMRGVPDVAGDAEEQTGMALAIVDGGTNYMIGSATGTSAATPLWAGIIAMADEYAGHDLGSVNPAIYRIARSPAYHRAFHDVTTGNNTVIVGSVTITGYQAAPGWDPVTGWGTPDAQVLVPLLARTSAS
jgi:subtilase family serine protease